MTQYRLTLYVAGPSARSDEAINNLRRLCETSLPGQYELQVIDVVQQPEAAEKARIFATPTLIKESPEPSCRIIGDLSDTARVRVGLDLQDRAEGGKDSAS
ncbi:MAG: circadian clock protein KaiB [Deltaproteobacteria bacterium]|nr:circadian clock protein KaiB [Deltaproteobacteria bacterium]